MVEVGGRPILWHIMKMYSNHGVKEFIICCGYKSYFIKEYFANYFLHMSDVTFDMSSNEMTVHKKRAESWKVTLVDTGLNSMTGGRLRKVKKYLADDNAFCFTYGDGVSDVNISSLIKFHKKHGKQATVTGVRPPGRFGTLDVENEQVNSFLEKPKGDGGMINGGFFVLNTSVIDLIQSDSTIWEQEPLEELSKQRQLMCFEHNGFWQPMDTLRDKVFLEELWTSGKAPWKTWDK